MSKHTKKVERKATVCNVTIYKCDFCGQSAPSFRCRLCHRDVCTKHQYRDYGIGGDEYNTYCLQCWEIGERYRERLQEEEDRHDKATDKIEREWKEEAIAASKEQK